MTRTVVVGAGLVGLACAHALQREGHAVTVLDRGLPGHGASYGNAAQIAIASIIPQATPGILRQTLTLLRDPQGPLVARPAYVARHLAWFLRFLLQGRADRTRAGTHAMAALLGQAWSTWRPLLADVGADALVSQSGALHVFGSSAAFEAARGAYEVRRELGIACEWMTPAAARELEPALTEAVQAVVRVPGMGYVRDTLALTRCLVDTIQSRGAQLLQADVLSLDGQGVTTSAGRIAADRVVLAAGAWSDRFASRLGVTVPMVSERGYHVMLPADSSPVRMPLLLVQRKVAVTPMADGIRLASVAEFTAPDAGPDPVRVAPVFAGLERWVRGLDAPPVRQWVGPRPSTPDSRPILGHAPKDSRVLLAYGHGHLGLSLAALTGQVIADLAQGRTPAIDMRSVSPSRRLPS